MRSGLNYIRKYTLYLLSIYLAIGIISCRPDAKTSPLDLQLSSFNGEWRMDTAYKDGKQTKLLDNAFFKFDSLGNFSTNIQGDNTLFPFELKGNTVHVDGGKPNKYNVLVLTSDTLIMATRLRNFDFKFVALKVSPE